MKINTNTKEEFTYGDDIGQAILNLSVAIDNVYWTTGQLRKELDAITIEFSKLTGEFNS